MPTINNMTFKIAGAAGQGVESSGAGFAQALAQGGLQLFAVQDYMSRIRGGLNFFQVRVHEQPLYCHEDAVHILLPLNKEALEAYQGDVVEGGGIIYDESLKVDRQTVASQGRKAMPVPLLEIAKEHGERVMANTAALGAAAGVVGFAYERLADVIRKNFKRKGDEVVAANLRVARGAYLYAQERYAAGFAWKLQQVAGAPQRLVMAGNQAFALGALAGGCRFMSAYPMTPATSIIEWMAKHEHDFGVVTKHAEDEIAAINMAIGANFVGARAMTATSGGGFALMAEALGLAGMNEVPLVVVNAQRGGPSTGLPTRTEQSDLQFVLSASQGEFPRLVLAPGTIEECFEVGWRSFNLAERYQTPVIVLTDQLLAASLRTVDVDAIEFDKVEIDRGKLLSSEELDALAGEYKRHLFVEDGISPTGGARASQRGVCDGERRARRVRAHQRGPGYSHQDDAEAHEKARNSTTGHRASDSLRPRASAHRAGWLGFYLWGAARGGGPAGRQGQVGSLSRPVALSRRGGSGSAPGRKAGGG